MSRNQRPVILNPVLTLYCRSRQISHLGCHRPYRADKGIHRSGNSCQNCIKRSKRRGSRNASHSSFNRLLRTQDRGQLMFSQKYPCTVRKRIAPPGTEKNQPYKIEAPLKHPCQIDKAQHNRHIDNSKKCRRHLLRIILGKCKYIACQHEHKCRQ